MSQVEIPGWLATGLIAAASIVVSTVKVMRWAEEKFLPRTEYKPEEMPDCGARLRECESRFYPRAEAEQAMKHRADRTHELAQDFQKFILRERTRDQRLVRMETLLLVIAEKVGVPPPIVVTREED